MNTSGMCNVTEFAAKCGVSIHTILRWVEEGRLKSELSVGGTHYFSNNSLIEARKILLHRKKPINYLAVLVADDADALAEKRAAWNEIQKNTLPNGNNIKSLTEFMRCLGEAAPPVGKVVAPEVVTKLAHNMVDEIRIAVKKIAFGCVDICRDAQCLPVKFFMDMAFGKEPDSDNLGIYKSLPLKSFYSPMEIRSRCLQKFWDIAKSYGFYEAIKSNKWSLEQLYYDGESLLTSDKSCINPEAPKAKREYKPREREAAGKAKLSLINEIARQGYFTVIEAVGSLTKEQEDFITNAVLDGDYTSIYFSSRNIVSNESLRDIGSAVRVADMKFIVADEANE